MLPNIHEAHGVIADTLQYTGGQGAPLSCELTFHGSVTLLFFHLLAMATSVPVHCLFFNSLQPSFAMSNETTSEMLSRPKTVPAIKWEYSGIDMTARVILAINPNGHRNTESVENYIMYLATDYCIRCQKDNVRPTITGTGGWYVTFVPSEEEGYDYNVEVTLMSYVVEGYLKRAGVIQ